MRPNSFKFSALAGAFLFLSSVPGYAADSRLLAERERSFPNGTAFHYRLQSEPAGDKKLRLWAMTESVRAGSTAETILRNYLVPESICESLGQVRFQIEIDAESQAMDEIAATILNDLSILCDDESLNEGRLMVGRKSFYSPYEWKPSTTFLGPKELPFSKYEAEYEAPEG